MDTQGTEKRVVRVTIFQQPYSLRASGEAAETEAIAQGVDNLMNQIADRTSSSDPARVAVLAALHLADKIRTLESRTQTLEESLGESRQQLLESSQRAEQAESALEELDRASQEDQSKSAVEVHERAAGIFERLNSLDARLADLLTNKSH